VLERSLSPVLEGTLSLLRDSAIENLLQPAVHPICSFG
jgi:hypothetical protein